MKVLLALIISNIINFLRQFLPKEIPKLPQKGGATKLAEAVAQKRKPRIKKYKNNNKRSRR